MSDERTRDFQTPRTGGAAGNASASGADDGDRLREARARAERLGTLASAHIHDVLSGDSERYVRQSRQHGGQ